MNTEALQCFIKVYEKKSVTSAAKDLFITPQGLSKTIKQLELDLEVELFFRGSKGMEATEYGELLYARAKHICYLLEDIKKEISIINGNKRVFNVVVTYSATTVIPPDLLFGFSDTYPDIQMKLKEYPDEYSVSNLFQEEADAGLVLGHEGMENCEYELLVPGEVVALVSKKHRLAGMGEISILDLKGEPLILKAVEQGAEHRIVDKCLESGFAPDIRHETGNIATSHVLCDQNGLIAISIDFVERAFGDDKLEIVKFKEKIPQNIYLVTRKRDIPSMSVAMFRSYMRDCCKV